MWLNHTLDAGGDAALESGVGWPWQPAGYAAYPGYDCNFDDIGSRKDLCVGKTQADCVVALEGACNASGTCWGFNYPGCILKKGEIFALLNRRASRH